MVNTITITQPAYKELLTRISKLEKMLSLILEKFEQEPAYGSDEWWDWSNKKAMDDIREGRTYTASNPKELKKLLDSWK